MSFYEDTVEALDNVIPSQVVFLIKRV